MFLYKPEESLLKTGPEIPSTRTVKAALSLIHTPDLAIFYQGGGTFNPF